MAVVPNPRSTQHWLSWRSATDAVAARIAAEVSSATGISEADFGVLARLEELGAGQLRQSVLAQALTWSRPRLSTHLTRMEDRGLVARTTATAGAVVVALTTTGRRALASARPVHEAAVRRHLFGPLDTGQLAVLDVAVARWGATASGAGQAPLSPR